MTNYKITKVSPQQLRLQVKYTEQGKPDYWINLQTSDFSEDAIHALAQSGGDRAREFWAAIDQLPNEVAPASTTGVAKPRVYVDAPDHDKMEQDVTFDWVETDDAITQTWTISDKSDDDKAQALSDWRSRTVVSMRQARLALADQGYLSLVKDAITLIPEPDKAKIEIEWEYASTVERTSAWVSTLQPALGLNDEQMDALFDLAKTL